MESEIAGRVAALRKLMNEAGMDTLMVSTAENRRYLSGFTGEDTQFDESAGVLLVSGERLVLATDSRYVLQARGETDHVEVICYEKGLAKALPGLLRDLGTRRLGFESVRVSVYFHGQMQDELSAAGLAVTMVPVQEMVELLRVAKAEKEIFSVKASLALAESAFISLAGALRPGMTEREAAWELEKRMREAGAEGLSFPVIVASGPNSALPHAIPGDRRLEKGEPILFDWGARLYGYCSDISRTVVFGSRDDTFRKVYDTVLRAQQMATEAIRSGKSSREVDAVARDHIDAMGFAGKFGHGLGHGVGLAIHEAPRLSPLKDTPLATGMVATVEPGIYLQGWGGVRLENMVAVRRDGAEVLNGLNAGNCPVEL